MATKTNYINYIYIFMIHLYILAVLSSCIYLFILLTHSFSTKDPHCKRESTIIFQAPLQHISTTRPSLWHHPRDPPTTTIAVDHERRTNEGSQQPTKAKAGPQQATTREVRQIIGLKRRDTSFEPRYVFFCIYPLYLQHLYS
jgi:hypothetical protein